MKLYETLDTLKRDLLEHCMYYLEFYKVDKDFIEIVKLATQKYYKEKDIEALKNLYENVDWILWYFKLTKWDMDMNKVKQNLKSSM